ncbi:hypothetical protein ACIQTZ_07690 [Paenarthrobacter sp. NPDC090520]|uniref:hypothetical protein n=1 Tax=Paenarthrobacter sp. NPDC090520 TaxID=3364382 RepID=UPI003808A1BB
MSSHNTRPRALGAVKIRRRPAAAASVTAGLALTVILGSTSAPATADSVIKTSPVGENPGSIAVNTATDTAYVSTVEGIFSVRGGGVGGGKVYSPGDYSSRLAVNSVTNKIYASDADSVVVIDGVSQATTVVPIGGSTSAIAVNDKTNKVFVGTDNGLTIIDGASNTSTAVPITAGVQEIDVNTTTNKAYVRSAGTVKVIDGSGKVTSPTGTSGILSIAVNAKLNKI